MDMDDFNVFDVKKNDLDNFGGPNVKEQGLQILNSGHIIQVGVISRNVIEGVCIQSSHPSDTPHKITINTSALWKDWKFSCSCKAGLSQRCKHIYGVLCYIERFKKVEVLTCTQKQQRWNQASKEVANSVLEPSKIIDLPEVKKKNVQLDLLPEEKKLFTQVLFGAKNSAVSKFMTNYMNRKRESVKESVVTEAPIGIAAPIDEANEIQVELVDPSKKDTIEYYLNELFATHDLKQKIHFFDRESTPMHVIELYNKWICIDNRAAVAVHINTLRQDGNFERKKDKRMRIKTEDSYQLFTFFTNKKRTDDELKRKAVSYLKKKKMRKV